MVFCQNTYDWRPPTSLRFLLIDVLQSGSGLGLQRELQWRRRFIYMHCRAAGRTPDRFAFRAIFDFAVATLLDQLDSRPDNQCGEALPGKDIELTSDYERQATVLSQNASDRRRRVSRSRTRVFTSP